MPTNCFNNSPHKGTHTGAVLLSLKTNMPNTAMLDSALTHGFIAQLLLTCCCRFGERVGAMLWGLSRGLDPTEVIPQVRATFEASLHRC